MDLQKENLLNEKLQEIEIFDKPGLFSNGRLRDEDVPEGLYRYDLRGSDYDPGQPITVEKTVVVNHAASVLMAEELDLGAEGRLELGEDGLNFTGAELTVREFMEEQQQKGKGLIHGDSDHITVEGHIGTWYSVDETEIGGEKFFLLEHEEHGDMAACVAVNEQGKLVAEDLWNGFDEDFQEAVQKYLSEKWNMPKKEDVVSEIIEKAVPVPDNSAQDYSAVPVYYEPFSYAKENDEVDLFSLEQAAEFCKRFCFLRRSGNSVAQLIFLRLKFGFHGSETLCNKLSVQLVQIDLPALFSIILLLRNFVDRRGEQIDLIEIFPQADIHKRLL